MNKKQETQIQEACDKLVNVLDSDFLRALVEPMRVEIIKLLLLKGRSDIGGIAKQVPVDRSVVSRHMKLLLEAGLLRLQKEGRHRMYELNAKAMVKHLESMLARTKHLISLCCPKELE